jgi:hypothetical protein
MYGYSPFSPQTKYRFVSDVSCTTTYYWDGGNTDTNCKNTYRVRLGKSGSR